MNFKLVINAVLFINLLFFFNVATTHAGLDARPSASGGTLDERPSAGGAATAQPSDPLKPIQGLLDAAQQAGLVSKTATPTTAPTLPLLIGRIVGGLLALVGILFMILMIYGGITWMLARGNAQEVDKAKDTVTSAILGIIVVALAYVATQWIFSLLTKAAQGG